MKKLIASLLAVALVVGLSISLVGCGGNKNKTGGTTSSQKETSGGTGGKA